jgi:hypothetical protein
LRSRHLELMYVLLSSLVLSFNVTSLLMDIVYDNFILKCHIYQGNILSACCLPVEIYSLTGLCINLILAKPNPIRPTYTPSIKIYLLIWFSPSFLKYTSIGFKAFTLDH